MVIDIPVRETPQRVRITANMAYETEKADATPNTALATNDTRISGLRPNLRAKINEH